MTTMLEEFGLTNTEEKVYLAMLKLGSTPASDIIKETQLHRTTVYDVLNRLISKGLVSFIIKNKIRYYSPTNPSKFLDIALEEEKKAEKKQRAAKRIIKYINSLKKEQKHKSIVQIFVGIDGEKTVMDDIIETGEDFYIIGGGGTFRASMPIYTEQWAMKRRKKNIRAKIISTEKNEAPKWKLNEIRYIPKEYQAPAVTFVYGNKVAIFIHEEPINIIVIESTKVARAYKNYFNLLWKIAKK